MKRKLHCYYALVIALLAANTGNAQINYTANFDADENGWESRFFEQDDELPCNGDGSFVGNLYIFGNHIDATSPSVGTSNGGEISLSYSYKILDYDTSEAITNDQEWGFIKVYYAIAPAGPFRLLQTIDPSNHAASVDCAAKNVTFFAPEGSNVYIRVEAEIDNMDIDFNIHIDDVVITQAAPATCTGIPAASAVVAPSTALCNGTNTTLSLFPVYTVTGLNYQWQSSADGVTFTNIVAGTSALYTTSQTESTWYRAVVTCTESTESFTTEAVSVINTGRDCLCTIDFDYIEPITRVNFAGIDNASYTIVDATPGVEDFTSVAPGQVTQGETYTIALEGNTNDPDGNEFLNYFTVFIDWNQNGNLNDSGERYTVGSISSSDGTNGVQTTGQIVVPATATLGLTNMRILKLYDSYSNDPCSGDEGDGYGQAEDYLVNVLAPTTGTEGLTAANFKYYPNPVTNVLNVSYVSNITGIEVFNIVGQKVLHKAVNQNNATLDMSLLTRGTYMVKVASANGTKTIKVIKQ